MQTWVKNACAQWNSDQKDTGRTSKCDYASGTRGVITRDSVKWVFTGQSAEEQAQEWQERLQSAQATDQSGEVFPCPLSMFSITQTSEGGSIALTATTVTRQYDLVRFSQRIGATKKEILWSNGPWLGKEIGPAWESFYETQGFPPLSTV